MTIEQVIQLGDDLKAFTASAARQVEPIYEAPPSALPPGCPIYTTVDTACKLFGIGRQSLDRLIRANDDFPAVRLGRKTVVDVPGLYAWLHERNGTALELPDD